MTPATLEIDGRRVGPSRPAFIVAELSGNHHGDYEEAVRLVRAAAEAGADAVKLQTLTPDSLTLDCDRPEFKVGRGSLWAGSRLYDLYKTIETPWEWQPRLKKLADSLGLVCFSSAFSPEAADFLDDMGVGVHKIASFELVDIPLIEHVSRKGKPVILSTGLASFREIAEAVQAARRAGAKGLALLKCTSAYPAPPEEMNLRAIPRLAKAFQAPAGLSDHTMGWEVAVAGAALGACIIEKHFTLSRSVPGPDSAFSMEPAELAAMVRAVRNVEKALGGSRFEPASREAANRMFRRSLFAVKDIARGETFTPDNVRSIRPAHGLPPKHLGEVLGRTAVQDIERGTPLSWELVAARGPLRRRRAAAGGRR